MRASFVMSGVGQGLRRNVLMSIALIMITFVSLYFLGGALLTQKEIAKFRSKYEDKLNVSIFLCGPTQNEKCKHPFTPQERASLETHLRADPLIASEHFVSQNEIFKNNPDYLGLGNLDILQPSDFPNLISVKLKDIKRDYVTLAARYNKAAGVEQVQNQDASLKTITIQVAAAQRRNETNIMRLVGASRWMTQLPFVLEAVITALIGGVLIIPALWFSKTYVLNGIFGHSVSHGVLPDLSINDVLIASGESILIGVVLAIVTAYVTLRAYVRL